MMRKGGADFPFFKTFFTIEARAIILDLFCKNSREKKGKQTAETENKDARKEIR